MAENERHSTVVLKDYGAYPAISKNKQTRKAQHDYLGVRPAIQKIELYITSAVVRYKMVVVLDAFGLSGHHYNLSAATEFSEQEVTSAHLWFSWWVRYRSTWL
jgi:hypothetical protein